MQRIFLFIVLCYQLQAQSSLFVDLPHAALAVGWNDQLLDSNVRSFVIPQLERGQMQLRLVVPFELDTITLNRTIAIDGNSDYRYQLVETKNGWRLRYRGSSIPDKTYQELSIDSTKVWSTTTSVAVSKEEITLPHEPKVPLADSTEFPRQQIEIIAPQMENAADSVLPVAVEEIDRESLLQEVCSLEMEFERLREARKLAMEVDLNEEEMSFLLRCFHYDNSRLLFLYDVYPVYGSAIWFEGMEKYFDFAMSGDQFRKMLTEEQTNE